jgi:NAD(P)-dependent dehydrogenase (short-subunit alcohol dehydrogenase family)
MCVGFAQAGCRVIGCSRSTEELAALHSELGELHRLDVVDVASDSAVAAWSQDILSQYAAPDFLINNAAVINANASLWEIPANQFDRLTAVNISGTANTIRHFVPAMIEKQSGVIVNFSSGWGRSVSSHVAPYCASKWAIEGLTQALAEELPAGMAAVPLNPGVINTQMLRSCFGSGAELYPSAVEWAKTAVPFILQLTAADNGRSLTVPA